MISNDITQFKDMEICVDIGRIRFFIMLDSNFFNEKHILSFLRHKHGVFEIFFIKNGKGKMTIRNQEHDLKKNHIYFVNKGSFHKQLSTNTIEGYSFQLRYEVFETTEHRTQSGESEQFLEKIKGLDDFILEDKYDNCSIIKRIHQEMADQSFGFYTKIQTYFTQIIINILRLCYPKNGNKKVLAKKNVDQSRTEIIDNFIYDNFNTNCYSYDLANLLGVSERQLNRILKEEYNTGFKQKMLEMRMEVAMDYLLHTDFNIDQISEMVGYNEPSNFNAIFKKKMGIPPGQYRKCHVEKDGSKLNERSM